jgi:hypothetical protein
MPPSRKPAVAIRRPPPAPDVERFVTGAPPDVQAPRRSNAQTPRRSDVQASSPQAAGPGLVKRKDGRTRRRTTVYFPPDLATRLAIHCASEGVELSDAVTAAVTAYLERGAR